MSWGAAPPGVLSWVAEVGTRLAGCLEQHPPLWPCPLICVMGVSLGTLGRPVHGQ